jgi:hypothetical protein
MDMEPKDASLNKLRSTADRPLNPTQKYVENDHRKKSRWKIIFEENPDSSTRKITDRFEIYLVLTVEVKSV